MVARSKIVVVASSGPMGSSVVAAAVEKFGYINVPLRNVGLHDVFVGNISINGGFKKRVIELLLLHCQKLSKGGVNVVDRDNSVMRYLVDPDCLRMRTEEIRGSSYEKVEDLYCDMRKKFAELVVYKENNDLPVSRNVKLTTDIHKYDIDKLMKAYEEAFDDVVFIFTHRNFISWLDTMFLVRFVNPQKRYIFVLRWLHNQYMLYEKKTRCCEGLHLDFDSMFFPDTEEMFNKLSTVLNEPVPDCLKKEVEFDLYGKMCGYEKTFTQADNAGDNISFLTRKMILFCIRNGSVSRWHDILIYPFYLFDMMRFFVRRYFRL